MEKRGPASWRRASIWVVTGLLMLSIAGCRGCVQQNEDPSAQQDDQSEDANAPKREDFESMEPVLLPGVVQDPVKMKRRQGRLKNDPVALEQEKLREVSRNKNYAKPGHWHDVRFQTLANNFDVKGELATVNVPASNTSSELLIPSTGYYVTVDRPVALPKGEWKMFESSVFLPPRDESFLTTTVRCSINRPGGAFTSFSSLGSVKTLQAHQHHLVLLTTRPDTYQFLEMAPTIRLPGRNADGGRFDESYVVIASTAMLPVPLPRQPLNWTTIAYLIWDDLDPDDLDSEQQAALIDWLHFGGQLILSGPDCLERLESSFLANYLPAQAEGARNLAESDIQEFNDHCSLPEKNAAGQTRDLLISEKTPLLAIGFLPHTNAREIEGTSGLVVERPLGRGRIVATAFSINAPVIRSWRSFDSFLNNILMRRIPRHFLITNKATWDELGFRWLGRQAGPQDPRLHSTVRFLSRDLEPGLPAEDLSVDAVVPLATGNGDSEPVLWRKTQADTWRFGGFAADRQAGVGGWNDFSGVSNAARATLNEAASIRPPSSGLVLKLLAGYLLILVPLNWLVFRSIGKVEWAWVAAPVIAVVGAFLVIRVAALDIGFVRSNTQIGVLEIPAEFDRGHLTEYSALYTSLSTAYEVKLDNLSSLALPFSAEPQSQFQFSGTPSEVKLSRTNRVVLDGLQIRSSTTQYLHAEHLLPLGGGIQFQANDDGTFSLVNQSVLQLTDAYVVGVVADGDRLRRVIAPVDELAAGASATIRFDDNDDRLADLRSRPLYESSYREANQLWDRHFESVDALRENLADLPELAEKWDQFQRRIIQKYGPDRDTIEKSQFVDVYQELTPGRGVTLGRLLDAIDSKMLLTEGEYCLLAATSQPLGDTEILPQATQTDRQTLVVAHLTHPPVESPSRDRNSPGDLAIKSDLDYEQEMQLFDEDKQHP